MAKVIHFVCSNWSMKDYELEQSIRLYHQNGTKCFHCKCLFIYVFIELFELFILILLHSNINDIHEALEVTVYDEDKDRVEFLGKVAIPLLKVCLSFKYIFN